MRKTTGILAAIALMTITVASANDLGVVGKLYPVKERDALEELESRAAKVNWKKELAKVKPENYRPENSKALPRATKNRTFQVDMTYTLEMDIPDGKGGIVYPKGYKFNPLDYMPFGGPLVIINGDDKDQVAWFKKSEYADRIDAVLLLTEGSYMKLGEALRRPVYYSDTRYVNRFHLEAVPSVVRQNGRMMEVEEVDVRPAKKH